MAELRREYFLQGILKPLYPWYDFILVDCPSSLGLLTVNAVCASQQVLVPTACDASSLRGLPLLFKALDEAKERTTTEFVLRGILPTKYEPDDAASRDNLQKLRESYGDKVLDMVIDRVSRETVAQGRDYAIQDQAPENTVARSYQMLASALVADTA
jgi:chromosome partitioning protein